MRDTRVLTAISIFLSADETNRDAELMKVVRVLNNLKDEYDAQQNAMKKRKR